MDIKKIIIRKETSSEFTDLSNRFKSEYLNGLITKDLFIDICSWKSPRRLDCAYKNSEDEINKIIKLALEIPNEIGKIKKLMDLAGVRVPMASTILTMYDPDIYGVIDTRAWNYLYEEGYVFINPKGENLTPNHWGIYLNIIRKESILHNVSARLIDLSLYEAHKQKNTDEIRTYKWKPNRPCR